MTDQQETTPKTRAEQLVDDIAGGADTYPDAALAISLLAVQPTETVRDALRVADEVNNGLDRYNMVVAERGALAINQHGEPVGPAARRAARAAARAYLDTADLPEATREHALAAVAAALESLRHGGEEHDQKGRGPAYWRGFADGRLAERAGAW